MKLVVQIIQFYNELNASFKYDFTYYPHYKLYLNNTVVLQNNESINIY